MVNRELPYRYDLIEQFIDKRYPDGAKGLGVALGKAMDKDSGR